MLPRNTVERVRALPPYEVLRRGLRKGVRLVGQQAEETSWRLRGTDISDATLLNSLNNYSSKQEFLRDLKTRSRPPFFIDAHKKRKTVALWRERFGAAEVRTIVAAEKSCERVFDLLGSGEVNLGECLALHSDPAAARLPWHDDFKTGYRFDKNAYYKRLGQAPFPGGYDIKVPWELSRCQHFVWLGQAYWLTNDTKYARAYVAQTTDWITHNPPRFGVNWASAMDVAIRAVNWLWGFYFFQDATELTEDFLLIFFKSLLAHGRHIRQNLEKKPDGLANNHYIADLVGLVHLGFLCPEYEEAEAWRDFGLGQLWAEMLDQVAPDGVSLERSTAYHRLAAELFLTPLLLCQLHHITVPAAVTERMEKILEFVMHYTRPDGTVPLIGDADNGRLLRLQIWQEPEREWVDHRYLLAIGAVLFGRDDFARAAGDQWQEAFWLLGERVIARQDELKVRKLPPLQLTSNVYPDGGVCVLRQENAAMYVNIGRGGARQSGHAHNDLLSFAFYSNGQEWLVDPGTYVYTADYEQRNLFRSTAYHNTVAVDNQEISPFQRWRQFELRADAARPRILDWQVGGQYDLLLAQHSAYERLSAPVQHRRLFIADHANQVWLIQDSFWGSGNHQFDWHFHCAVDVSVSLDGNQVILAGADNKQMILEVEAAFELTKTIHEYWLAPAYGVRRSARAVRMTGAVEAPFTIKFCLRQREAGSDTSLPIVPVSSLTAPALLARSR